MWRGCKRPHSWKNFFWTLPSTGKSALLREYRRICVFSPKFFEKKWKNAKIGNMANDIKNSFTGALETHLSSFQPKIFFRPMLWNIKSALLRKWREKGVFLGNFFFSLSVSQEMLQHLLQKCCCELQICTIPPKNFLGPYEQ